MVMDIWWTSFDGIFKGDEMLSASQLDLRWKGTTDSFDLFKDLKKKIY